MKLEVYLKLKKLPELSFMSKNNKNLKKMLLKSNLKLPCGSLTFLLMLSTLWNLCGAQGDQGETPRPSDGHGADGSAFFALRSCHQLLRSDNGEFFSPDYLCSNPPLWCNWTIQVDPEKRIHLHLEDLTPDETCQHKRDQIHVDEPADRSAGHKVLQRCWQEAKYTSSSNTLYVVLLIGGWPNPSYRGFHARYQAFGPPVVYNPHEGFVVGNKAMDPAPPQGQFGGFGSVTNTDDAEDSDPVYDYYDQHEELLWDPDHAEVDENLHPSSEFLALPTVPSSIQRTFRSGRETDHSHSSQSDSAALPDALHQHGGRVANASSEAQSETAEKNEGQKTPQSPEHEEENGKLREASEQLLSDEAERLRSNTVEQRSDQRGNVNMKNNSESPHLPGDHLFEVSVEVNFIQDLEESWDQLARLLLLSVKTSISKQLEALQKHLVLSSKRIKRLNAGALYILWLQIGQGPGGGQIHRAVHSAMQGLLTTGVNLRVNRRSAVVMSVSTADVNECGTQLVLCDKHADCVNLFGSYSCRCRPGFRDDSRLGSGGTICVDAKPAGCSSAPSSETRGVYVLFFLLSFLILTLLVVSGALYHRHHRGAFLVHCHSNSSFSPPDVNNNNHMEDNYSCPTESDLPPPPPPARSCRDAWAPGKQRCPPVDLPLLRFSPLLPPDGYTDPHEGVKM